MTIDANYEMIRKIEIIVNSNNNEILDRALIPPPPTPAAGEGGVRQKPEGGQCSTTPRVADQFGQSSSGGQTA